MAKLFSFLIITLIVTLFHGTTAQSNATFLNPILDMISPDPQLLHYQDNYYLILAEEERNMVIYKSPVMTDFRGADLNIIYQPNSSYDACWAPELHEIDGDVYIYFSMHLIGENDHRMWVSKAEDPEDLMGPWTTPIQLMTDLAEDANDGTIFKHPTNGNMYYVWTSLRPGVHVSSLYIAPMQDAMTVLNPRVLLRVPQEGEWDCLDACLNEGAHMLYSKTNVSHLVFSGSGTGSLNYALGYMSIQAHLDPLIPENWEPVVGRVFMTDAEEDVYGPGHAAFTTSPDGTEVWMAYHAQLTDTPNNKFRIAHIDKMDFDEAGYPIFPKAHGFHTPQPLPSGQV